MKFRSLKDIEAYYTKELRGGNTAVLNNLRTSSGKTFSQMTDAQLQEAAEDLRYFIQFYIDLYYTSYSPVYYKRTYGLRDALKVDTKILTDGGKRYIGLYYDDSKSWGESVYDGGPPGYKPYLISEGWTVRQPTWFRDIEHFGHQGAYDFVYAGIIAWKHLDKYPNIEIKRVRVQDHL